jgi:hypothetical protein
VRRLPVILTIAALAAAGCGGGDDPGGASSDLERPDASFNSPEGVAASDTDKVLEAQDSITTNCGLTENQEGSDVPLEDAISTIQSIYRQNPEGIFAAGVSTRPRSMETVLKDNAQILRDCGKTAEAAELESALGDS